MQSRSSDQSQNATQMRQQAANSEGLSVPLCACRIHTVPFHPEWLAVKVDRSKIIRPEDCTDAEQLCTGWAADGG